MDPVKASRKGKEKVDDCGDISKAPVAPTAVNQPVPQDQGSKGEERVDEGEDHSKALVPNTPVRRTPQDGNSLPRFVTQIYQHSTAACARCQLYLPGVFVQEHIGNRENVQFVLEDASGRCEWAVTFDGVGFRKGWLKFAIDYDLEERDAIVFSLVAPHRLRVNVFDNLGMEKMSPRHASGSPPAPALPPKPESGI